MTADTGSGPDAGAGADQAGAADDLTTAYRRLSGELDGVPTPKQFTELEVLAGRLEVTVHPAQHDGTCIDRQTGEAVDPELAAELLWRADRQAWLLDAAEVHQAEVVAGIPAHAGWRSLTTVQRRSLSSWRQRYPGLTYGTLLAAAPAQARRRLELHAWLLDGTLPEPEPAPVLAAAEADGPEFEDHDDESEAAAPATGGSVHTAPLAKGAAPDARYAETEVDSEALAVASNEGIKPPDGARGFIRIDPYGTANRLNDVIISYFDKLELPVPHGSIGALAKHIARYNGIEEAPAADLPVGQYVWFPDRGQLAAWSREGNSKR